MFVTGSVKNAWIRLIVSPGRSFEVSLMEKRRTAILSVVVSRRVENGSTVVVKT